MNTTSDAVESGEVFPKCLDRWPSLKESDRRGYDNAVATTSAKGRGSPATGGIMSWRHSGFSGHNAVTVPPGDTGGIERLA
jgi:hypothetical protein